MPTVDCIRSALILCAVLIALMLWVVFKLSAAHAARQASVRSAARMEERERIARDLHDTLLQSVHALLLRLNGMLLHFAPESEAHKDIEHALDLVQAALKEGQDKLHGLRSLPRQDFLTDVRNTLLAEYPDIPLICGGTEKLTELDPDIEEQLRAIATEALRNAVRHASASLIRFEVAYGKEQFLMIVGDDGCGMSPSMVDAGCCERRLGLVGMSERAEQIGAQISLESKPGQGTVVRLSMSAARVYSNT